MDLSELKIAFNISLYLIMPLGFLGMALWIKKVLPRVIKHSEKKKNERGVTSLNEIAFKVLIYSLPGIIFAVLLSIPTIFQFSKKSDRLLLGVN